VLLTESQVLGLDDVSASPTASSVEAETSLLLEFTELWSRGLADTNKLWQLFDVCEMYMYRPDYFGAPVYRHADTLMTPVFSALDQLTAFVAASPTLGAESGADGFDWVRVSGAQLFGLPVRARYLWIDPGTPQATVVDLASRVSVPPLANGAPPVAVNLEIDADGNTRSGLPDIREDVH
jgi:hypothetical protein